MEWIELFVGKVNGILWDFLLLILLCGTGIYFTLRTRFVQVRHFKDCFRRVFGNITLHGERAGSSGMSSFQALTTAIAAQVGTGNIAGAATAIHSGGPGAIFWMWLSAFFGMATIYSEAVLAQSTKTVDQNGNVTGGPAYYIRTAFKGGFGKFLTVFFSIAIILALGFMGNMVQSNSISVAFEGAFGIKPLYIGLVCSVIAALIFLGGVGRIAAFTEKIVPIMAVLYSVGCIIILIKMGGAVGTALKQIFVMAFSPQSIGGGALGITVQQAMRYGIARGLFSNEAGMGSTPHAHAIAKVERPEHQGYVAMMGVFIDTFVVLTLTALVIISTGVWNNGETGVNLAQSAFFEAFGNAGMIFIAICMLFFAFSTIIGWYFFGKTNVNALFSKTSGNSIPVIIYAILVIGFIALGSTMKVDLVWDMSDMFNGLMVIPNLLGLLALSGLVLKITRDADRQ